MRLVPLAPLAALTTMALVTCLSTSALAAGTADAISVVDPYVRMAPPGAMATGAFMVIKNGGDKDAKLVKVENTIAKVAELHTHLNEGGVMKMRLVPAIDIKAKGEATLQPGGLHIMLIELKGPMKEGDKIPLTLGFADGSSKQVNAEVRKPVSAPMPAADHSQHKH